MKSIFSRDLAGFGESLRALTRRLIPVFVLTIAAGLLSGYVRPTEAETGIPDSVEVHYGDGDVIVSFHRPDGQKEITNIVGLRGVIAEIVAQALEERAGQQTSPGVVEEVDANLYIRSNYVASFPILFERARLDSGSRAGAAVAGGAEFAVGAAYDTELNRGLIRMLVESLAPCGEEDGTRPVWLSVRGYASSAPFRDGWGEALPESRELNVGLANMRRRSVESALRAAIVRAEAERRIRLTPGIDYTLHTQLERDRKFNDRPDQSPAEAGSLPQDLLTRVAYVNVLSAARCAPD
ncbi:MAG: hypothetical protein OXI47_06830 [Gammaproteobacteria bacterium]|nr:hypothetical protein [Gammaproteobacteria bacterium]